LKDHTPKYKQLADHVLKILRADLKDVILFISSKEILLIAEDEVECIPYIKKRILKVLTNNDDDNTRTAGLSKQISIKLEQKL